ncbi:MAG: response regulator transcription factor [Deltaproteobacteria bacterium]|nr:response regulator transcription factor [Deltaproteobacteria bacterium]
MESAGASVLVVEDDETLAMGLVSALEHERFSVVHCDTGEKALELIEDDLPDVMILDWMLPGMDGLSVLRKVKGEHPELPVILLTAKSAELDRVLGLEMGADDYVPKPFSLRELIARVRARLRSRPAPPRAPEVYRFGRNEVDLRRRILVREGDEHRMTTHEAGVLQYLIAHRGRDVSREELLQNVWGYSPTMATRTVDNQILKLRKKIEDSPADPRHILTVHGTGYRFEE